MLGQLKQRVEDKNHSNGDGLIDKESLDGPDNVVYTFSNINSDLLREILTTFDLHAPVTSTKEEMLAILNMVNKFRNCFQGIPTTELSVIFKDGKLVNITSSCGQKLFTHEYTEYPCAICEHEVLDGMSVLGQGLSCHKCSRWFHNSCTSVPLSLDLYENLSGSPDYVHVVCPECLCHDSKLIAKVEELCKAKITTHESLVDIFQKLNSLAVTVNTLVDCTGEVTHRVSEVANAYEEIPQNIADSTQGIKTALNTTTSDIYTISQNVHLLCDRFDSFSSSSSKSANCKDGEGNSNTTEDLQTTLTTIKSSNIQMEQKIDVIQKNVEALNSWDRIEEQHVTSPTHPASSRRHQHHLYSSVFSETSAPAKANRGTQPPTPAPTQPTQETRTRCDETRTVSIGNCRDPNLVKHASVIKSHFNKCFPLMEIEHCFGTQHSFIMIELKTADDAMKVVREWKTDAFFNPTNSQPGTFVNILQDVSAKGIIKDVDKSIDDAEISDQINKHFIGATARRFINKQGKLHTVLINFKSKKHLDEAIKNKIIIYDSRFAVEVYRPQQKRGLQCYNCYHFDHLAVWCRRKKTCCFCAQHHDEDQCLIKVNKDTEQYKCVNCGGNHTSIDKSCPKFQQKMMSLRTG